MGHFFMIVFVVFFIKNNFTISIINNFLFFVNFINRSKK
jgi:hypothetical protein